MYEESDLKAHVEIFLSGLDNPVLLYWLGYTLDRYIAQPRGMKFDFEYLYKCLHNFQNVNSYCYHNQEVHGKF